MAGKAQKVQVTEELVGENGHNPMLATARRVLLAGIGAISLAQEEVEEFVAKLVERGEIAEKDGRKLVKDVMEKRRRKAEEMRSEAENGLEKRVEELLARMNVATRSDIEALSTKVAALTKKVEELKKAN